MVLILAVVMSSFETANLPVRFNNVNPLKIARAWPNCASITEMFKLNFEQKDQERFISSSPRPKLNES